MTDLQKNGQQLKMGWFSGCTPTQHYTMLFNTFVMMTLFNQFAARKLNGEWNFFAGIQNNNTFLVLSVVEMGLQILFVQAFGSVVGCVPGGLTGGQWGWSILFGFLGWIWQLCINMIMANAPNSPGRKKLLALLDIEVSKCFNRSYLVRMKH